MKFQDSASAAEAAAKAAKQAIAAAQAAAYLANKDLNWDARHSGFDHGFGGPPANSTPASSHYMEEDHQFKEGEEGTTPPQSFGRCSSLKNEETRNVNTDYDMAYRRYSYNPTGIKFDESDGEEEETQMDDGASGGVHRPPDRNPPPVPSSRVHPKLPDYDTIAARFEALKYRKT